MHTGKSSAMSHSPSNQYRHLRDERGILITPCGQDEFTCPSSFTAFWRIAWPLALGSFLPLTVGSYTAPRDDQMTSGSLAVCVGKHGMGLQRVNSGMTVFEATFEGRKTNLSLLLGLTLSWNKSRGFHPIRWALPELGNQQESRDDQGLSILEDSAEFAIT